MPSFPAFLPPGTHHDARVLLWTRALRAFGDGIMRAIDFDMDLTRLPNETGDRVKIVMGGKYLQYKTYWLQARRSVHNRAATAATGCN